MELYIPRYRWTLQESNTQGTTMFVIDAIQIHHLIYLCLYILFFNSIIYIHVFGNYSKDAGESNLFKHFIIRAKAKTLGLRKSNFTTIQPQQTMTSS